jgi:hypothetical protein
MVAEIPAALTRELQLQGASPPEGQDDVGPFAERIQDVARLNPPDGPDWQLDTLSLKAPPRPPGPEMPLRAIRGGT